MKNNIQLGKPTEYGYNLPKLRFKLAQKYIKGPKETLLDFGCGNGANTIYFKNDFQKIVGIDVEKSQLEIAKSYIKNHEIRNIQYILYNGSKLPYRNNYFNDVVSFEVLEHTQDDFESLREIFRVLKKGGLLVLTVPNKWYLMETHGFNFPLQSLIPWNRVPLLSWLPDNIHSKYAKARIYSKRKILHKLESAGFKIKYHNYIMPPFDKVSNKSLKRMLTNIFNFVSRTHLKFFGVSHYIIAYK